MRRDFLMSAAAVGTSAAAMIVFPSLSAAQTPPMGGGYNNVITIPVDDPATKSIAGALFKPAGAGPFPVVIYMSGCNGISPPWDVALQKSSVDHYLSKGVATLIIDSFTPRHDDNGVCDRTQDIAYYVRRAEDAHAAMGVLAAMPDIDPKRVFLQGYSHGANAATLAVNDVVASKHAAKFAGVIAYYPYCVTDMQFSVRTVVFVGDKDDWTPAKLCEAIKDKPNLEVVVYPGATHAFAMTMAGDFMGHHMAYDEKATQDAQQRGDAFMAAHIK